MKDCFRSTLYKVPSLSLACRVNNLIKTSRWDYLVLRLRRKPLMPRQIFTARLEGFSLKNKSERFTIKTWALRDPIHSFATFQASISMRWGWIVKVVSHLCSTVKSDQIPVAVYLVTAAAAASRQTSDLITNGLFERRKEQVTGDTVVRKRRGGWWERTLSVSFLLLLKS